MYERSLVGNMARSEDFSGFSLLDYFLGFFCNYTLACHITFLHELVYPIVDGHGSLRVLLDFIGKFQARHLTLSKDIMKRRCTNVELLGYPTLNFVIAFHPRCELIHFISLFYLFFWTKIRNSDTIAIISSKRVENNKFVKIKENALTCII